MSSYGSIEKSLGNREVQSPRGKANDLLSRPWIRVALAAGLILAITLFLIPSSSSSSPRNVKVAISKDIHDEDEELFYDDQLVNHFSDDNSTWSNRYYKSVNYFEGPGHPIFMVVGGEGALDSGMLYPFVTNHLAPRFGAAVVQIEHRFYGPYQPIVGREATVDELLELLTPHQAMADMVRLTKHFKEELNCAQYNRSSKNYCPVITVGGSYPGFLSAMFRLVYPDFVDISYASSAPLKLYDQTADQYGYYDIVTKAAERLSPGCSGAVRDSLEEASKKILKASSIADAVQRMNVCVATVPSYIDSLEILKEDVMMAVGFTFADYDMDAYPPGPDLGMYKACQIFQNDKLSPLKKLGKFFHMIEEDPEEQSEFPSMTNDDDLTHDCFDLSVFLPDGDNARITTSDWSGSGGGNDGKSWDFQLCTLVVDPIGFSPESMFPTRRWTYEALTEYCQSRYGDKVTPKPYALVEEFKFSYEDLKRSSRILFTNGMQDMWHAGSYLDDVTDSILALNFENGAHHSDLSHVGPSDNDTEDIRLGFIQITNILNDWLNEVKEEAGKN
mmetsp:Transcript_21216/g.44553  ORF Transcript_21216/g.44553 Transcript_21216/m.44553 type:complete len:559 (+) Transcript_21216:121-1797(+)